MGKINWDRILIFFDKTAIFFFLVTILCAVYAFSNEARTGNNHLVIILVIPLLLVTIGCAVAAEIISVVQHAVTRKG